MKRRFANACLLVALPFLLWPANAHGQEKPPFSCKLSSTTTTVTEGTEPDFQVTVRNNSGKETTLVGSLDGSGLGSGRFPRCGFEVFDTAGKPVKLKPRMGCGYQNRLRVEDFVSVAGGADFNPFDKDHGFFGPSDPIRMVFLPPGTYRVRFVYQTSSGSIEDYMGNDRIDGAAAASPELKKLHSAVPVVDLKSNELTLTIVPKVQAEPKKDSPGDR